jgi:hypothetical protein
MSLKPEKRKAKCDVLEEKIAYLSISQTKCRLLYNERTRLTELDKNTKICYLVLYNTKKSIGKLGILQAKGRLISGVSKWHISLAGYTSNILSRGKRKKMKRHDHIARKLFR